MTFETIPLFGAMQASRSMLVNGQRSVNMYPSIEKPGAKTPLAMYPTPGLVTLAEPGAGPGRSNGIKWKGSTYSIAGNYLVKISDGDVVATILGLLTSGSGRCVLARGRNYLMIVDGNYGYYTDGTTLTRIIDADFPANPTHCAYLNGWFLANKANSDEYYKSQNLEDPTAWNALDFNTAIGTDDDVSALTTTTKDLYLLGPSSTEVHTGTDNPDFPFEPYPGGVIDVGIIAPHSLVRSYYGLIWLAGNDEGDAAVVRCVGFQIEPLSDDDLNLQINKLGTKSDAFASIHRRQGRTFYTLTFPTADRTYELDLSTKLWHERKSFGIGRWRGAGISVLGDSYYVGDYDSGKIYKFDDDTYTEAGATIERERITQMVHFQGNRFTTHELVIDMEAGVGTTSGAGSDPQALLKFSDDGGKEWSSEISRPIGKLGEYKRRVVFEDLGESYGRIYSLRFTDPVKTLLVSAYARVTIHKD